MHASYMLQNRIKKKTTHGATSEERNQIKEKKERVQKLLKEHLGINVDVVTQGGGTSNTGNVAKKFFKCYEEVSRLTGLDKKLLQNLKVILTILSCGRPINKEQFKKYTFETAKKYVELYGWYRMPPTLHKILIHSSEILANFSLPVGDLSEEAQEVSNKIYKKMREHHTRKNSRLNTIRDLFNIMMCSSDPLISSQRNETTKKKKSFSPEELALLDNVDTDTSDSGSDSTCFNSDGEYEFWSLS